MIHSGIRLNSEKCSSTTQQTFLRLNLRDGALNENFLSSSSQIPKLFCRNIQGLFFFLFYAFCLLYTRELSENVPRYPTWLKRHFYSVFISNDATHKVLYAVKMRWQRVLPFAFILISYTTSNTVSRLRHFRTFLIRVFSSSQPPL